MSSDILCYNKTWTICQEAGVLWTYFLDFFKFEFHAFHFHFLIRKAIFINFCFRILKNFQYTGLPFCVHLLIY